jgi:hypothetical protein
MPSNFQEIYMYLICIIIYFSIGSFFLFNESKSYKKEERKLSYIIAFLTCCLLWPVSILAVLAYILFFDKKNIAPYRKLY